MTAAEFFSQPGGFLAQTLPIALLCFAPFGDSELKFPRRADPAVLNGRPDSSVRRLRSDRPRSLPPF